MRFLVIDYELMGLNIALRAQAAGHYVKLWQPNHATGEPYPIGLGMVEKPKDWKREMDWADLILPTGNSKYTAEFKPFFENDYPLLGANEEGTQLELDRGVGQKVLEDAGVDTLPYEIFSDYKKAIDFVKDTNKIYVSKPFSGDADKALSYVSKSPADMVFKLGYWEKVLKTKGKFLLQEFRKGVEFAVSGWFGPGGWCKLQEENWEEKKLMNDNLGVNTGEQGTTMRYCTNSKLFKQMLTPITEYLHSIKYVGNVDMNCIVDEHGDAWPLEFTTRLGWPAFNIQQALMQGDPIEWMSDLLDGKDTLKASKEIVVGVVLTHGYHKTKDELLYGFPIYNVTSKNEPHIHWCQVQWGKAPIEVGGTVKEGGTIVSAGAYIAVVTGTSDTVQGAAKNAYKTAWELEWPSDKMMRTDISKRLKKHLPELQKFGYATGVTY